MAKDMQTSIEAINKFIFYCYNHPSEPSGRTEVDEDGSTLSWWVPGFIMQAEWTTNRDHMISKWIGYAKKYSDIETFHKFYGELDDSNRKIMLEWIMTHYDNEQHLSF